MGTPRTFRLSRLHHLYTGAGSCLASFRTAGAYRHPALLGSANSCSRSSSRSPPDTLRHHGQFSANGQCFDPWELGARSATPEFRSKAPPRTKTSHEHFAARRLHHQRSLQGSQPTNRHHPPTLPSPPPPSTSLSPSLTTTSLNLTPLLKQQSHAHDLIVHSFPMPPLDPRMPSIGAFLHNTSSASQSHLFRKTAAVTA